MASFFAKIPKKYLNAADERTYHEQIVGLLTRIEKQQAINIFDDQIAARSSDDTPPSAPLFNTEPTGNRLDDITVSGGTYTATSGQTIYVSNNASITLDQNPPDSGSVRVIFTDATGSTVTGGIKTITPQDPYTTTTINAVLDFHYSVLNNAWDIR